MPAQVDHVEEAVPLAHELIAELVEVAAVLDPRLDRVAPGQVHDDVVLGVVVEHGKAALGRGTRHEHQAQGPQRGLGSRSAQQHLSHRDNGEPGRDQEPGAVVQELPRQVGHRLARGDGQDDEARIACRAPEKACEKAFRPVEEPEEASAALGEQGEPFEWLTRRREVVVRRRQRHEIVEGFGGDDGEPVGFLPPVVVGQSIAAALLGHLDTQGDLARSRHQAVPPPGSISRRRRASSSASIPSRLTR